MLFTNGRNWSNPSTRHTHQSSTILEPDWKPTRQRGAAPRALRELCEFDAALRRFAQSVPTLAEGCGQQGGVGFADELGC